MCMFICYVQKGAVLTGHKTNDSVYLISPTCFQPIIQNVCMCLICVEKRQPLLTIKPIIQSILPHLHISSQSFKICACVICNMCKKKGQSLLTIKPMIQSTLSCLHVSSQTFQICACVICNMCKKKGQSLLTIKPRIQSTFSHLHVSSQSYNICARSSNMCKKG